MVGCLAVNGLLRPTIPSVHRISAVSASMGLRRFEVQPVFVKVSGAMTTMLSSP